MPSPLIVATVFGIAFLAELPDKSLFASLVLGTRYRALFVWVGVAAAFAVHVTIAVLAGGLLTLLPHQVVDAIVAALFLAGAAYLLLGRTEGPDDVPEPGPDAARQGAPVPGFGRVAATSFGVVIVGEWGDLTQVTTANLAARYDDPISVAVGAGLGLWAIAGLAIMAGSKALTRIPLTWVRRVTAAILVGFGAYTAIQAVTG